MFLAVLATENCKGHHDIRREIIQLQISLPVAKTAIILQVANTGIFTCCCRKYKHLTVESKGPAFAIPVDIIGAYNLPVKIK